MPKLKSHRGTAKRFRVTKNGKVKRWRSGARHLLLCKTSKRLRKLRKGLMCHPSDAKRIRILLNLQ